MKILLIDAGSNRTELNEPYGIEILAGTLKEHIKEIEIDFKWLLLENIDIRIIKSNYDLIGISAKLGTLNNIDTILSHLQQEMEHRKVVIGGPLSTFGYNELIKRYKDIIYIRGEGETALLKLCSVIAKNGFISHQTLINIPNIVYCVNGDTLVNERIQEDLMNLSKPHRYYINEIKKRKGIARIENSRGCSWSRCDFCSVCEHYGIQGWRPFPINYIIDQLVELSQNGILSPYFTDEDFFGGDYLRSEELAKRIIDEKEKKNINPDMNFFFSARINDILHIKDSGLLELWKKAGLRELFIGLESGVNKQLKRYGKAATAKKNALVINLLKKLDIQLDTGYILFDPEMDFGELIENIEYIEKEKLSQHDSRSLKKMRAQPFTKTTGRYFHNDIINGDLDLNLLFYPLKYKDRKVYSVMQLYDNWESEFSENVYSIQALSRGEVKSEDFRKLIKDILGNIREIDFVVLKILIQHEMGTISYSQLNIMLESKRGEKNDLINNLIY